MSLVTRSLLEKARPHQYGCVDTGMQLTLEAYPLVRPPIPSRGGPLRAARGMPQAPGLLRLG